MEANSLSEFVRCIAKIRIDWPITEHKELWFRGERYEYKTEGTFLHPALYRRPKNLITLKPIHDLLKKEADLYDDFKRCAVQLSDKITEGENWNWDAYFLMRHHSAPTRLLDWTDGALIALHFAIQRREIDDDNDAIVYVLEPDLLKDRLETLPDAAANIAAAKRYAKAHPNSDDFDEADSYLPPDTKEDGIQLPLPVPPMVLDFPHITRRVAAQRSRFVVLGSDPDWLSSRFDNGVDFPIKSIVIDGKNKKEIRQHLRDSGIVESVIYPDLDGLGREMLQLFWEWRDQPISTSCV